MISQSSLVLLPPLYPEILALGAGCTFGVSLLWGSILLAGSAGWAYKVRHCKPSDECCKGGACCKN